MVLLMIDMVYPAFPFWTRYSISGGAVAAILLSRKLVSYPTNFNPEIEIEEMFCCTIDWALVMKSMAIRIPSGMKWMFPEYDFQEMRVDSHQFVIIERVLERGSWEQLRWLFNTYGEKAVAEWVQNHGFRLLSKRSFALWRLALGIREFKAPDWAFEGKEDGW